jgi:hypothetical protein
MTSDEAMPKNNGPSGRLVGNFSPYCEGDLDPSLNKRICILIDSEDHYIVYLDDNFNVMWSMTDDWDEPTIFGKIANRVTQLEVASEILLPIANRAPLRRLLGEAISRAIGGDAKQAEAALNLAESFLQARSVERARVWYFGAAAFASTICALILATIWIWRIDVAAFLGRSGFDVMSGTMLGGVGAFFAIVTNSKASKFDASAGPGIHFLAGSLRVLTGLAGAFMLSIAIKGDIVFGFVKHFGVSMAAFYAVCFVAGWSERLAQTLIVRVEGLVADKERHNVE